MLNMIVCIKQVPDTEKVKIDKERGILIREGIENIMNPDDLNAVEMAISLRERYGGKITAITMGPDQAQEVLFEAFAIGVDEAVLVSDESFQGSDTLITSLILSKAINLLGHFDIILCGVQAIDGYTSHVGYQLSEFLSIPLITQINNIEIRDDTAIINRLYGHEYQKIKVSLPILLTCNMETNIVRYTRLDDIRTCFDKDIKRINMSDIGGSQDDYGIKGSPTIVISSESFSHKREHVEIQGNLDEKVDKFIALLKKHDIFKY